MTQRSPIRKTPKCYSGGNFIRSESARVYPIRHDNLVVHIPQCSRKDVRNAVEAAAKSAPTWQNRSGYNRGQILYRLAEMLEARHAELREAVAWGAGRRDVSPDTEVSASIDMIVHFAGWCDKFEQCLGSVNPVASSHFCFTVNEPLGVCAVIAPESRPLIGLLGLILPLITGGNPVVALASGKRPYPAILLGEMLATSDLPGGVVNLLTGFHKDLLPTLASHGTIRGLLASVSTDEAREIQLAAAESVKRVHFIPEEGTAPPSPAQALRLISQFLELKTVWHPLGA